MIRNLVAAALLAACARPAHAQIQEDLLQSMATARSEPGPPRRGCGLNRETGLPTIAELSSSADLIAALEEFAARYPILGDSTPFALYSVTVGNQGQMQPLRPLAYLLPSGQVQPFGLLVEEALRQSRLRPGTFRIRVTLGTRPAIAFEPSQRCAAEVRTRLTLTGSALGYGVQRPLPARARVLVAEDGRIINVHLLSSSGSAELDRWIQDALLRSRAVPGLLDGTPVQMEVTETIQIQTRG